MLYNYFKIAIRFFKKNLSYSVLNVLGLSIGLASAIICLLHINYEFSYDKFHSNSENIYRLVSGNPNSGQYWACMAAPVPVVLKENFPEVEEYIRIGRYSWDPKTIVKYENKSFNVDNFLLVDPSFFKVFDFKLIQGNEDEVLSSPNSVVITESNAKKFFGNESPIGKMIKVDGKHNYEIKGIVEDAPFNSHLDFDFLISFENLEKLYGEGRADSWGALNYWVYLLFNNSVNEDEFNLSMNSFISEYIGEKFGKKVSKNFALQPLLKIHFQGNRGNMKPSYDIRYIYIFSAIALAVLIIAIINFINFINAISEKRVKEAGLRKTVGALKGQIIRQFIIESILISVISLLVSFLIVYYLIPLINQILNNNISLSSITGKQVFLAVLIALIVGIVSGSYIAFYVSSFSVVSILKGIKSGSRQKVSFSNVLIVFQIVISSLLIISSIVIIRQLNLFKNRDIGLDKKNIINVSLYGEGLNTKIELFKNEIQKSLLVESASASSFMPGKPNFQQTVWWEGQQEGESQSMYIILVDKDFLKTLNIELVEGNLNDLTNINPGEVYYVLNEAAVKECNWDSGLGKVFSRNERSEVKGVVKNFNFMSLHNSIDPLVLEISDKYNHDQILIRVNKIDNETIAYIGAKFKEIFPDIPFEYTFLTSRFNNLYNAEIRASKIISFLSVISIIIALFGVFALISFSIKEKTKEIAIRKVLGISTFSLYNSLTKGFNKLFLIGCIISWPIAYYLLMAWLNNFSYKTSLNGLLFLVSALLILGVIQLVISIRVIIASRINPSYALRYE